MALPPPKYGEMGHCTGFLGRWNYPQWRGTRPNGAANELPPQCALDAPAPASGGAGRPGGEAMTGRLELLSTALGYTVWGLIGSDPATHPWPSQRHRTPGNHRCR